MLHDAIRRSIAQSIGPRRGLSTLTLWTVVNAGVVLSSVIFLNDNVLETTRITGSSMSPTLSPAYKSTGACDWVLWNKWNPAGAQTLQRGDLVLFRKPHDPEVTAVKRVVALGGDVVILDPRRRPREVINGRVSEEARRWGMWEGRILIPDGHVWLEGDGWRESLDSHTYGPVSRSLIQGRAVGIVWPIARAATKPWEQWEGIDGRKTIVLRPRGGDVQLTAEASKSRATWKGYGEGG